MKTTREQILKDPDWILTSACPHIAGGVTIKAETRDGKKKTEKYCALWFADKLCKKYLNKSINELRVWRQ